MLYSLGLIALLKRTKHCIKTIKRSLHVGAAAARQRGTVRHIERVRAANPNGFICDCCNEPWIDAEISCNVCNAISAAQQSFNCRDEGQIAVVKTGLFAADFLASRRRLRASVGLSHWTLLSLRGGAYATPVTEHTIGPLLSGRFS